MSDPLLAGSAPLIRSYPLRPPHDTGNQEDGRGPNSIPKLEQLPNRHDPKLSKLRQLWSDIFLSPNQPTSAGLKARGVKGLIPVGDGPSLRWLHWKIYLSDHLSLIPSSWPAILDRERQQYSHWRRCHLRAPDGNFPPEAGINQEEEEQEILPAETGGRFPSPPHRFSSRQTMDGRSGEVGVIRDLTVNNPLSLDTSNPWKTHYASLEIRKTIALDVDRTFPDMEVFRSSKVKQGLTNALFVWAKMNEDIGYRQGMHELAAAIWLVRQRDSLPSSAQGGIRPRSKDAGRPIQIEDQDQLVAHVLGEHWIEHDTFTMFASLMQNARSWFVWKQTESKPKPPTNPLLPSSPAALEPMPITIKCERIREILRTADPSLAQHMDSLGIEPQLFALRWVRLMFTREFPLDDALHIWDGLFASDQSLELIDFICVAMLLRVRNELLAADYSTALQVVLRYPLDPAATRGSNHPSLLVTQALALRDGRATPAAGVSIVIQNRDLLGIPVRGMEPSNELVSPKLGSSSTNYQPRTGGIRSATVGRSSMQGASRGRLGGLMDPLSPPLPSSTSRFGLVSSASYLPEGISDFAKGLYERSDSLGLNRALGNTMANVQKTVAAAASAASASSSSFGSGSIPSGGFPASFNQPLPSNATRHRSQMSASISRASGAAFTPASFVEPKPALTPIATSPTTSPNTNSNTNNTSSPALHGVSPQLEALISANKILGGALSSCIDIMETNWLTGREKKGGADGIASRDEDFSENDVQTLMSFTALKHIRDVLKGTASEFDPAIMPSSHSSGKGISHGAGELPRKASIPDPLGAQNGSSPSESPASTSVLSAYRAEVERAQVSTPLDLVRSGDTSTSTLSGVSKTTPLPNGKCLPLEIANALPMALAEYSRYGRQMILPDFGLPAQLRLRRSKVLVIGAGGLGCPAIQYLAAAGVGKITILDHDVVEKSNLARQILHNDDKVGMNKAESAARAARIINPYIEVTPRPVGISSENALEMVKNHDIVLDCTDNPLTRYLISDAAVLAGKQVVSGAAQGYEGQLVVLHKVLKGPVREDPSEIQQPSTFDGKMDSADGAFGRHDKREEDDEQRLERMREERGPCYRCLFPISPKPDEVTDCEDGGVLGTVTGLIGTMQALETLKILTGIGEETKTTLLIASPVSSSPYRSIRLRSRRVKDCISCGDPQFVGRHKMIRDLDSFDYVSFCGLTTGLKDAAKNYDKRVRAQELKNVVEGPKEPNPRIIVDVRPKVEFEIAHLPGSFNLPFATIRKDPVKALEEIRKMLGSHQPPSRSPVLLCRRGNDSLTASRLLNSLYDGKEEENKEAGDKDPKSKFGRLDMEGPSAKDRLETDRVKLKIDFTDVVGGIRAYAKEVDPGFPVY
ncbi:hypothetical protein IE53DRAFT_338113 [Violaceomyces palustris]|uniref:Uncharacterized protein n=1 Tax=Violaceomyces palustris TaxID=1673888 RepID=A0ACD0P6U5_9BASI|nr:hypothetical protein IE53DRAFT_338113 [Violaceomyces palustris]